MIARSRGGVREEDGGWGVVLHKFYISDVIHVVIYM